MRLAWKLALLVAIAAGAQVVLNRYAADLDEAQFAFRVYVAHLGGGTAADTDVVNLADELQDRQAMRAKRVAAAGHTAIEQGHRDEDEPDLPTPRVNASFPSE